MTPEEKIGQTYNMLTVLALDDRMTKKKSRKYLLCECKCGNIKSIRADAIGKIQSCGCIQAHRVSEYCKSNFKQYNQYDMDSEDYGIGYTNKGEKFIFDKEDFDKIKDLCWHIGSNGYLTAQYNNKHFLFHRLIMSSYIQSSADIVDHIQHNLLDNRKQSLRVVTQSENGMNKSTQANNTSGHIGVSWSKSKNKWEAYIGVQNRLIHLGRYDNYEEAVAVRESAEQKYFNQYSFTNSMKHNQLLTEEGEAVDNT